MAINLKKALMSGSSSSSGFGLGETNFLRNQNLVVQYEDGTVLLNRSSSSQIVIRSEYPEWFEQTDMVSDDPRNGDNNNARFFISTYGKWSTCRFPAATISSGLIQPSSNARIAIMDLPNGNYGMFYFKLAVAGDYDVYFVTSTNGETWNYDGTLIYDTDYSTNTETPIGGLSANGYLSLYVLNSEATSLSRYRSSDANGTGPWINQATTGLPNAGLWGTYVNSHIALSKKCEFQDLFASNGTISATINHNTGFIYRTVDGLAFSQAALPSAALAKSIHFLDNKFVAVTTNGKCYYSTDCLTWILAFDVGPSDLLGDGRIAFINGMWVFTGDHRTGPVEQTTTSLAGLKQPLSVPRNVFYITDSLSNPSYFKTKILKCHYYQFDINADKIYSPQWVGFVHGIHNGNLILSYHADAFGTTVPKASISVSPVNFFEWMYNEETLPQFEQYETFAICRTIATGAMGVLLRSGKMFCFSAAAGAGDYGSNYRVRNLAMTDDEEFFVMPVLHEQSYIGTSTTPTAPPEFGWNECLFTRVK